MWEHSAKGLQTEHNQIPMAGPIILWSGQLQEMQPLVTDSIIEGLRTRVHGPTQNEALEIA